MTYRNREIDRLRAYAVLAVILHHGALAMPGASVWDGIVNRWFSGTTGVDLFFVISGFVIAQSFLARYDVALATSQGDARRAAVEFYQRRLRRLYPASVAWATIILLGTFALNRTGIWLTPEIAIPKFIANAIYLSNFSELQRQTPFGYYWSLALEMQFYLLFPLFLTLVRNVRARAYALLAIVVLGLFVPTVEGWWLFRCTGLALGVALYLLVSAKPAPADPFARLAGGKRNYTFTAAALVALLLAPVLAPALETVTMTAACLISFVLVYAATFEHGYIASFGADRVLDWIGSRSYSLYLAHIPIMIANRAVWSEALRPLGMELTLHYWLPLLGTWLVALCLAAEASYRWIELPFQRPRTAVPAKLNASPAA